MIIQHSVMLLTIYYLSLIEDVLSELIISTYWIIMALHYKWIILYA